MAVGRTSAPVLVDAKEHCHGVGEVGDAEEDLPLEPPSFPDDLAERTENARKRVGRVRVPPLRRQTHPEIEKALAAFDQREEQAQNRRWGTPWELPDSKRDLRRLRLLNAMFLALGRLGARPQVGLVTKARDVVAIVGETRVPILLEAPHVFRRRRRAYVTTVPLELRIAAERTPDRAHGIWEENKTRLDDQLAEVVAAALVAGETLRREREVERHRLRVELAEMRKREERAGKERAEKARVDRLIEQTRSHRLAEDIRALVAAASRGGTWLAFEDWATWALATADSLDPVRNGQLARAE